MSDNYPEFPIPEGLDLEDLKEGNTKEMLAVVKKKSNGTACLVSLDGIPVSTSEEEVYEEEYAEEDSYPESVSARAAAAGLM